MTRGSERSAGLNSLFNAVYPDRRRASVAPENLVRSMIIKVLYSVAAGQQLMPGGIA
jgi:transposase